MVQNNQVNLEPDGGDLKYDRELFQGIKGYCARVRERWFPLLAKHDYCIDCLPGLE